MRERLVKQKIKMTTQVESKSHWASRAAGNALLQVFRSPYSCLSALAAWRRDKKLILARANPRVACSVFSDYKEAVIESRTVVDSRGRVLAQVKLWIYRDSRKCFREAVFLNTLLRNSVGLTKIGFLPLDFTKADTPAALIEVTVRDFEGWVRNRTAGTQFGIEGARAASLKPVDVALAPLPAPIKRESVPAQAAPQMPVHTAPLAPQAPPQTAKTPVVPAQPFAPPPTPAPPTAIKTKMAAPVQELTRGILTDFGQQDRTVADRSFKQFGIDLTLTQPPDRGTPTRIWGTDLERCLNEAQAKRGDHVEVHFHGSITVPGGGNRKNGYTVLVLPS
jgi:hypothetical protein